MRRWTSETIRSSACWKTVGGRKTSHCFTTGSRHPEQIERQRDGHKAYWDTFWDTDQVFYGHVLGFQGPRSRAVVLVVNEESKRERSRERLYVGLSRARDQLVVCGHPEFIRDVGGPDLASRLNLP